MRMDASADKGRKKIKVDLPDRIQILNSPILNSKFKLYPEK